MPRSLLPCWDGADPSAHGRVVEATFRWRGLGPATDYDRACDVRDYAGAIPVGDGEALVLAGEPLSTALVKFDSEMVLLARWYCAESDEAMEEALGTLDLGAMLWEQAGSVSLPPGQAVIFDSAYPGNHDHEEQILLTLPGGRYEVDTANHDATDQTSFHLVRMRRRMDEA